MTILAVLSLMFIFASRLYIDDLEHDLSLYYSIYQQFTHGDYSNFFRFGTGIEIGWTSLYFLVSFLLPSITAIQLSLIHALFCCTILLVFIYVYIYSVVPEKDQGLVSALIILFLSFTTLGYLQRQAVSTLFLMFMIVSKDQKKLFLFYILAIFFHSTALPFGAIYLFLRNRYFNQIKILILILLLLLVRLFFYQLAEFMISSIDFAFLTHKLHYFLIVEPSISSRRFLILLFPLLILSLFFKDESCLVCYWRSIILFSCVSYLALLIIPLLSERLNFILLYLYGFFIYLYIRKYKTVGYFFIFLYLIFFVAEKTGLVVDENLFWQRFDLFSFEPFYYLWSL
ncbi:EpsG family protein [Campylobacter sputorum]|uniref:EpsG family protein n=1 Tax=Campylobacter sputorum TaxID=206 RepID=UPI002A91CBC1|nr:EpsG family protein [Campylobacter sputorum]